MRKKQRDKYPKKEMEYEDAPSGYVSLYNYKEPYTPYQGGYGFEGALLFDGDTDKIQCHICGKWFEHLIPHIKLHGFRASTYKREVGLSQTTALISETTRSKLIASGLDQRLQNLRRKGGWHHSEASKNKIAYALRDNPTEMKNTKGEGTCPMQLIDRLKKLTENLGRPPAHEEIPFIEALEMTFGSAREAFVVAGIHMRASGMTIKNEYKQKYKLENTVKFVKEFYSRTSKLPKYADFKKLKRNDYYELYKKEKAKIDKLALHGDGLYRHIAPRMKYTREELVGFLIAFKKHHGRNPSASDCKRGLLPPHQRYAYAFGSWKEALKLIN